MFAGLRRSVRFHPLVADSVLAVVLAGAITVGALVRPGAGDSAAETVAGALFVLAALALVARRTYPYACLAVVLALTVAGFGVAEMVPPLILPAAVALYSVGTVARGRTLAIVGAITLVVSIGIGFLPSDDDDFFRELVFEIAWVVGALALGVAVANRRAYVEQMRQRAIQAERTKEEEAQRRADEERMRIARDVHDGVAHALASISIQAGAGSAVISRDPEAARQVFQDIRAASSAALSELRSTLGLLRHEDERGVEGMDREEAEKLAAVLRAEGIRVVMDTEASSWTVGGKPGAALYRILQESLTNVLRHAGATEVRIALRRSGDVAVLTVTDNGRGPVAAEETRGYGLVGMRERAALLGGSVETGPRPGGGFQVRATLPLEEEG